LERNWLQSSKRQDSSLSEIDFSSTCEFLYASLHVVVAHFIKYVYGFLGYVVQLSKRVCRYKHYLCNKCRKHFGWRYWCNMCRKHFVSLTSARNVESQNHDFDYRFRDIVDTLAELERK
jgi:transposase-like protein